MAVWEDKFIGVNTYARSGKKMISIKKIVMHYTANNGASAMNHYKYFNNLRGTYASAHFFVDSVDSLCIIPLNEIAYHANDVQQRVNGVAYRGVPELRPNANFFSVGIEMCLEKDGSFHPETIRRAEDVAVELCKRYRLDPLTDIVRHYDVTHKNCPAPWVKDSSQFVSFKNRVNAKFKGNSDVVAKPQPVNNETGNPVVGKGDKGDAIKGLQKLLNDKGYKLDVDGIFGAGTDTAVRDYQKKNGLTVDGIVGEATWNKLLYVAPKPAPTPEKKPEVKPAPAPTPVKKDDNAFRVIVGSFKDRDEADKRVAELKKKKVEAFVATYKDGKNTFFRVVAGSYNVRDYAEDAIKDLAKLGFEAFLLPYKK